MPSVNSPLSSPSALAGTAAQGLAPAGGPPPAGTSPPPAPHRDPFQPPAIHLAGRRRPSGLIPPSSGPSPTFAGLPLEMQHAVLSQLPAKDTVKVAQVSKQMRDVVKSHPHATRIQRLMSAPPPHLPDPAYLEELRACSAHLATDDVQALAQWGLKPRDRVPRPWLPGPLLSGRGRHDAEGVAQAIDPAPRTPVTWHARPYDPLQDMMRRGRMSALLIAGGEVPPPPRPATEQRDHQLRGDTLVAILGGIGKSRDAGVYEPFLERCARPSQYAIDHIDLGPLFSRIPSFASDRICSALLDETSNEDTFLDKRRLAVSKLFLASGPLSRDSQNAIHDRARELFGSPGHLLDGSSLLGTYRIIFSAQNIATRFPDSPEQRDKWNAFREEMLPT